MINVYNAPEKVPNDNTRIRVFLAGTIDNGESKNWQRELVDYLLEKFPFANIDVLNPRRPDWDSTWENSASNPKFRQQVEWELDMLESSDVVVMVFWENSKSPISLLELGLFEHKHVLVFCPHEFYRKGNIDIVCKRKGIPVKEEWEEYKFLVKRLIEAKLLIKSNKKLNDQSAN